MRPHKMVSEYLVLMFFSQPVKQLSDCGCKLDCGRLASVCEERRAAQCLFKFVVLEAQHDAVLRVVATQPSCISLDGWSTNLSLLIVL